MRVPDTTTFTELVRKIKPDCAARVVATKCSKEPSTGWIDVDLDADIGLVIGEFGCKYIRFMVADMEIETVDQSLLRGPHFVRRHSVCRRMQAVPGRPPHGTHAQTGV